MGLICFLGEGADQTSERLLERFHRGAWCEVQRQSKYVSVGLLGQMREIPEGGGDSSLSAGILLGRLKSGLLSNSQFYN